LGTEDDNWIEAGGDAEINRFESDHADDDSDKDDLEIVEDVHKPIGVSHEDTKNARTQISVLVKSNLRALCLRGKF
jgi:hypothetical protein